MEDLLSKIGELYIERKTDMEGVDDAGNKTVMPVIYLAHHFKDTLYTGCGETIQEALEDLLKQINEHGR